MPCHLHRKCEHLYLFDEGLQSVLVWSSLQHVIDVWLIDKVPLDTSKRVNHLEQSYHACGAIDPVEPNGIAHTISWHARIRYLTQRRVLRVQANCKRERLPGREVQAQAVEFAGSSWL